MPATSEIANKLADDLVTVGKILSFQSVKEAPVLEGSTYRVDVLWELSSAINVASIEIQYSNSPTSISHNIFKTEPTLHPAIHLVISYNELTASYKEILNRYPGVVLIEGNEEIDRFNGRISKIVNEPNEARRVELGHRFLQFLKSQKKIDKQREKIVFELWLERLFEPVVYEITVFAHFFEGKGTLGRTFFVTGTIEEAKATALKLFEERMTDVPFEWDAK